MQLCLFSDIKNKALTPMMQQYLMVKAAYQQYLLFYRMGDFYELFFDDAIKGAEIMNITLTKRGMHDDKPIPMCGVPAHAYEQYLEKLIKAGCSVAVCEQLETPLEAKKRGNKAVVRREVTRVITPGTIFEERLLDNKGANYLCAIAHTHKNGISTFALSWTDITTGEFFTSISNSKSLNADIARLQPTEILLSEKLYQHQEYQRIWQDFSKKLSPRADNIFDYHRSLNTICQFFQIQSLDGIGNFSITEVMAMGTLLEYLQYTQKEHLPKLRFPRQIAHQNYMSIDSATRRNLELDFDSSGGRNNSLFFCMDCTCTGTGGRLLASYLAMPLIDVQAINNRLAGVEFFYTQQNLRSEIRQHLRHMADMERIMMRIATKRASPRDLAAIRDSLNAAFMIFTAINDSSIDPPLNIALQQKQLCGFEQLLNFLRNCLVQEPPLSIVEGNFVRPGFDATLDHLLKLQTGGQAEVVKLISKYRSATGVANLKITHNNILGYFIEITPGNAQKMSDNIFEHRQSLQTAIRYTTAELRQLEAELITCDDRVMEQKFIIFAKICEHIMLNYEQILLTAEAIAYLDVASGLAELAEKHQYVRPYVDSSHIFNISAGRHPVVERNLSKNFIHNDCLLEQQQKLWILTGPNMAGKSTFLRQNALIAIMAQMGSFVPASQARIGVVDKLFSRIGAADDISRGQSTFMVEMTETAAILNNATSNSLVILDEVGRGTATYDGLAIAAAVLEELQRQNCRTLFATHYHELTDFEEKLENATCFTVSVRQWQDQVVFMHKVEKGKAGCSYGLHVAALAGLPNQVLRRAAEILAQLNDDKNKIPPLGDALEIKDKPPLHQETDAIRLHIQQIKLDEISPREALNILYELKKELIK